MKNKLITALTILMLLGITGGYVHSQYTPNQLEFIDKPDWFSSMDGIKFETEKELDKEWQSKKRCCIEKEKVDYNNRYFAKSCYRSAEGFNVQRNIVAKCLWLMSNAFEKENRIKIKEHYLENYFDHNKIITNCANCNIGDITSRISKDLAYVYKNEDINKSIKLLETALDKRGKETAHWINMELLSLLMDYYIETKDQNPKNVKRIKTYYTDLLSIKDKEESVDRRFESFERKYVKYLENLSSK